MIRARTRIKFLRRLGITLIALPEPFTTPFGVALVLLSRYLSKRHEASQNKRLRETVEYYLAHNSCFGNDAAGESSALGPVTRYALSEERAILGQITGSHSFKASIAPSAWQSWRDMQGRTVHHTADMQSPPGRYKAGDSFNVEFGWSNTSTSAEKVIHHTINMEWLSRCYEGPGSTVAHSSWACTSGAGEGAAHHSLNMKLLSQRYETVDVRQTKVKYHTINMALLQQRYGSAMYTMALKTR